MIEEFIITNLWAILLGIMGWFAGWEIGKFMRRMKK